jgi:membrane protein
VPDSNFAVVSQTLLRIKSIAARVHAYLNPSVSYDETQHSKLEKFIHFWALVGRTFVSNRCLVRASALAYTTLLSVIPIVAVGLSFASSFVDPAQTDAWIKSAVTRAAPQLGLVPASGSDAQDKVLEYVHHARDAVTSSGLKAYSIIALLFVGISLLSNIEATLNDIWGVQRGRSWFSRVVLYWSTITLVPILLLLAIGLSAGPYFRAAQDIIDKSPALGIFLYSFLPVLVLVITFSLFYVLMPNTRVRPDAALMGGILAGVLVHLNHHYSSLYLGQVMQSTSIYGGLAVLPLLLVGLYFSWVIVLFGAQVSYAWQNRRRYYQERMTENVNQRGREFLALRVMTFVAQRFYNGTTPPTLIEISEILSVPSKLLQKVVEPLIQTGLLIETASKETSYTPGRPLGKISYDDILQSMRCGIGQEVPTRDDSGRAIVRNEMEKIESARSVVASSITLDKLVT